MASTILSKIDAVNLMLEAIWESPVSTLDVSGVASVATAKRVLDETSRSVQTRGWAFNLEYDYPLGVDINGTIPVPLNALHVAPMDPTLPYVQRGYLLYDRGNHTFTFTDPVNVRLILLLEFEDLPDAARQYIAVMASRKFRARWHNESEGQATAEEIEALRNLEDTEADASDFNVLSGSWSVAKILQR